MRHSKYESPAYKKKQALITRAKWSSGVFDHLRLWEERKCIRINCGKSFKVKPHDPKKYCSQSCAATVNNINKGEMPTSVKAKIASSLMGRPSPYKGVQKVPRKLFKCQRPGCPNTFLDLRYKKRKFCSVACAMKIVGGKPTSPKASRGKAGIRADISSVVYFHSRWEANMARLYNFLHMKWEYEPKTFDIGGQSYTPDFYLPEKGIYIEVKNFWWKYSKERDTKFRVCYPDMKLKVILKTEYLKLQNKYARFIPNWEYLNSKFD